MFFSDIPGAVNFYSDPFYTMNHPLNVRYGEFRRIIKTYIEECEAEFLECDVEETLEKIKCVLSLIVKHCGNSLVCHQMVELYLSEFVLPQLYNCTPEFMENVMSIFDEAHKKCNSKHNPRMNGGKKTRRSKRSFKRKTYKH